MSEKIYYVSPENVGKILIAKLYTSIIIIYCVAVTRESAFFSRLIMHERTEEKVK